MSRRVLRVVLTPLAALLILAGLVVAGTPAVREAVRRPVPHGLRSVAATASTMTVRWAGVSSPRYRVAYSTSPAMTDARTAVFTDNQGTLEGLRPGRRYWLRVAAADHDGRPLSDWTRSGASSGRTLYRGGFAFLPPRDLRAKAALHALALRWRPVADAPGYRVEVARTRSMAGARTTWVVAPAARVTRLRAGTAYFVRVSVAARADGDPLSRSLGVRRVETQANVPPLYDLRVASYNISGVLADTRRNAPWSVRKRYVVRQLLGLSPADQTAPPPDAMVIQEANTSRRLGGGVTQYQDLVNALNADAPARAHYAGIFGNSNATRIVWNDRALDLVDSGVLFFRAQEMRVDGARMAPWAILRVKATGARFFLLSAHLETASEGVRRAQWTQLIASLPGLSRGLPVVLGGDFNSPRKASNNRTAATMLGRMRAAGYGDTLGQVGSGMVTTSRSRAQRVVKGNYNSVNRFRRTLNRYGSPSLIGQDVDYLFASNALVVKRWEMVIDVAGRTLRGVIPSDHNMIRAEIELPTPSRR